MSFVKDFEDALPSGSPERQDIQTLAGVHGEQEASELLAKLFPVEHAAWIRAGGQ